MCMCWTYSHSIADFVNKEISIFIPTNAPVDVMHSFPVIANKFVFIFKDFKSGDRIPCEVVSVIFTTRWKQRTLVGLL